MKAPNANRMLSVKQVSTRTGLKVRTIREWMKLRKIAYVRLGHRVVISEREVARLIQEGTVPALPFAAAGSDSEGSPVIT